MCALRARGSSPPFRTNTWRQLAHSNMLCLNIQACTTTPCSLARRQSAPRSGLFKDKGVCVSTQHAVACRGGAPAVLALQKGCCALKLVHTHAPSRAAGAATGELRRGSGSSTRLGLVPSCLFLKSQQSAAREGARGCTRLFAQAHHADVPAHRYMLRAKEWAAGCLSAGSSTRLGLVPSCMFLKSQ